MRSPKMPVIGLWIVVGTLCGPWRCFASDTIVIHGHIYTGNPKARWAQAMAFTGSRIDAVGTDDEISKKKGPGTKTIDLEGRTAIPGIVDAHTHTWYGALALHGFNLSTPEFNITASDEDAFVDTIKIYAASHPNERVLFGRAQFSVLADSPSRHELLDRAVPDRPLVIHATSEHALWVNAKALALAGIGDGPVADPVINQYVVRDANGHPTGVLREAAMQLVNRALPARPLDEELALLRDAVHYLNRYGITSIVNATGDLHEIELYGKLRDRGELTAHTRTAFGAVAVNHHLTPEFLADLDKARTTYHDEWVSANLVKFFSDGVGNPPPMFYDPAEYKKLVLELDKRGYQIVTHAIGAGATHMVLDTYEALETANGVKDRRLRMEHLFAILPEDLPRFARLSVTAGMQPSFCCASLPSRSHEWQSLERDGAPLAFSSDWPCSWPPNPLAGIQEAVTREVRRPVNMHGPVSAAPEYYLPEERVSVEQAIDAYTRGGAHAAFFDDRAGSLEPGKQADLAVLSQDIFAVPPGRIGQTRVLLTISGGKIVFDMR
jgi:predicted amidohydrolase YtcJ